LLVTDTDQADGRLRQRLPDRQVVHSGQPEHELDPELLERFDEAGGGNRARGRRSGHGHLVSNTNGSESAISARDGAPASRADAISSVPEGHSIPTAGSL